LQLLFSNWVAKVTVLTELKAFQSFFSKFDIDESP
jgi:hypothetical protein